MLKHPLSKNSPGTLTTQQATRESRGSIRQTVSISAEIFEPSSRSRLAARATDLSMGGCYVDTINPLEVGSDLQLCLTSQNRLFQTEARVLYATRGMGMGLTFTRMAPQHLEILRDWMQELGGGEAGTEVALGTSVDFEAQTKSAETGTLRDIVTELVTLLARKQVLTDPEVEELQKKLLRGAG